MKRNAVVLAVVAVVVAAMIYTGARNARKGTLVPSGEQEGVQTDLRGQMAPDFELNTLEGKTIKLSDLRGKAVVVNFWATWCGPCKIEMPWLVALQKKYEAEGLVILGLSVDEGSSDKVAEFVQGMGVNYPVLRSTTGVNKLYGGVDGLPTTFYVGRDGKVVEQGAGIISESLIEDNIKAALAQGGARANVVTQAPAPAGAAKAKP